ncbi:MAG TPA: DUF58 domain-containing protein [Anaerolineae bacterium]
MTGQSPANLFDESFLRRLERLALVTRRVRTGRHQGERRSTRHGSSVEFADYRTYTRGDDLRRLDWRIYARLERPFIKLFEEEEDQTVHLLLDASGSMDWPAAGDELNKWNFGRKLSAALGYITLVGGDRLVISHLSSSGVQTWGPRRGRRHIHALLAHLASLEAGGPTDLNAALRQLGLARQRPGLLFLMTDLFSPAGFQPGLNALGSAGYEVNVLHLLSPDEIDPVLAGDLRLYDVETGQAQDITIDPAMRRLYQRKFEAWRTDIERFCFSHDINYVTLNTSLAFDTVILGHLRQRGFVK